MKHLHIRFAAPLAPIALGLAALSATPVMAETPPAVPDMSQFQAGERVQGFGMFAPIEADMAIPADARFAISFDTAKSEAGKINRSLDAAARFLNMHGHAGVAAENIRLAVVVHGPAIFDMASHAAYKRKYEGQEANPNAPLIAELVRGGVRVIICGQSAAALRLDKAELLPGVEMALSAMTAHALLQQDGYTLNPF